MLPQPLRRQPDAGQWKKVADLAAERGFLPLVDMPYPDFEAGIEEQNLAVRLFAERCPELTTLLRSEVAAMRDRINGLRAMLVEEFGASGVDRGFSFLGLSVEQVRRRRGDFSIYTADSARVNVACLNHGTIDYFVAGLKAVPQN